MQYWQIRFEAAIDNTSILDRKFINLSEKKSFLGPKRTAQSQATIEHANNGGRNFLESSCPLCHASLLYFRLEPNRDGQIMT
jgi:cytochrome c5